MSPLAGKRYLKVTEHRTKKDWALFMQEVLEEQYPDAAKVVVVVDNLNTHTPASFYEILPPEQAKALIDRLEIHYTPKHASWLNIAEIELSVLARQGLAHNIATIEDLCQQVQSWQDHRNRAQSARSTGNSARRKHVSNSNDSIPCSNRTLSLLDMSCDNLS
jgi:hypothetical protein